MNLIYYIYYIYSTKKTDIKFEEDRIFAERSNPNGLFEPLTRDQINLKCSYNSKKTYDVTNQFSTKEKTMPCEKSATSWNCFEFSKSRNSSKNK